MGSSLSRRSFVTGAAAFAAAAACSKDKKADVEVKDKPGDKTTVANKRTLTAVMASSMLQTGIDERVSFALFEGVPASLLQGGPKVLVAFAKVGDNKFTDAPVTAEHHSDGIEERPYYVVRHKFTAPGQYVMRAAAANHDPADSAIEVSDPSAVAWPVPGQPLPKITTPTVADPMGVNPICTRTPAQCGLHEHSLHTLLGNGKPTVAILSTPALCKSAVCGPVLEILLGERAALENRVNLVHVEVYADTTGTKTSPAFAAFKTDTEPVMYMADKRGILVERFVGPFDRAEAQRSLEKLLAG